MRYLHDQLMEEGFGYIIGNLKHNPIALDYGDRIDIVMLIERGFVLRGNRELNFGESRLRRVLFLNGQWELFISFLTEFPKPVVIRLLADSVLIHPVLGCDTIRSGLTLPDDFHPPVAPNDLSALIHDVLPL